MTCYCGSKRTFAECCGPVIQCDTAKSPEQLMRSRYSAYCVEDYDYILNTYAHSPRASLSVLQLRESAANTQWLGLRIVATRDHLVTFAAYFKETNTLKCLQETSLFVIENNKWRYLRGDIAHLGTAKLSRNDSCFCGSGNKFKKCCLAKI
ncbi:zinc chelation protein SecC [Alteromonas sediminis]|uniref:Zinc chelation protein SecC n=1 Tax=Alteromonas sediminis TaxID=2259342 RepID=A0A3N5YNP3_9ALTE|nr:YchJ family metal-binding protein [Alteromonas sediminis]RPJ67311.1 zinc chelation protein SecC [Alteromonas sediminis]